MNNGERVSGRYRIKGKIGSGGMANVYLADDLILEREVAVKMMSLNFQDDADSLRRFQREALSTTELIHPNIVNIYDVGEGEQPYIVMEYVDGMDLKEYIQENHPIPYKKVIDIMSQILSGISYAHSNGVIHRDIKPHNILIDYDGTVKITDFGIAVALSQNSITQTNSLLGSVQYISPEQARGNLVTKQSDIYSLGIVLYEMLTSTVPFEGESAVSIALKHFQSPIPALRDFDTRIPQPLENVVLKATAKEPKHRYDSVEDMRKDLMTALDSQRRDEPMFVPADINEEDTLVLKGPLVETNKNSEEELSAGHTIVSDKGTKDEEPKGKRKRRLWLLLIPLILLILIFVWLLNRPQQIELSEEIIGLSFDDAIEFLEENELVLGETIERAHDEVPEGIVFDTSPKTGAVIREGSEVDLYVSLGEEPFEIENYEGETYEEVRAELTELGFTVESETDFSETVPEGVIISQDIDPGEEVIISETTIVFTVSEGRPFILLSNLEGYSRKSAQDYADNNGLILNIIEESSEDVPVDQVISQDPAPRTQMYAGDTITVVISTGPEELDTVSFSVDVVIPYVESLARANDVTPASNENSRGNNANNNPNENANENAQTTGNNNDNNSNSENSSDENPNDENNSDNPDNVEEEEPELLPNRIRIYIEDFNREIDDIAYEFLIYEDHEQTLNFVVEEGNNARYKIYRDESLIEEASVSPE